MNSLWIRFSIVFAILISMPVAYNMWAKSVLTARSTAAAVAEQVQGDYKNVVAIGTSRFAAGLYPLAFPPHFVIVSTPFMDVDVMSTFIGHFSDSLKRKPLVLLEYHPEMMVLNTLYRQPELKKEVEDYGVSFGLSVATMAQGQGFSMGRIFPHLSRLRLNPRDFFSEVVRQRELKKIPDEILALKNTGYKPARLLPDQAELFQISKSYVEAQQNRLPADLLKNGMDKMIHLVSVLNESGIHYCWLEMPNRQEVTTVQNSAWPGEHEFYAQYIQPRACLSREFSREISKSMKFSDPVHLHMESAKVFAKRVNEELTKKFSY